MKKSMSNVFLSSHCFKTQLHESRFLHGNIRSLISNKTYLWRLHYIRLWCFPPWDNIFLSWIWCINCVLTTRCMRPARLRCTCTARPTCKCNVASFSTCRYEKADAFRICSKRRKYYSAFPTYNKSADYYFGNIQAKIEKFLLIKVSLLRKFENIVTKGEIAHHEQFLV